MAGGDLGKHIPIGGIWADGGFFKKRRVWSSALQKWLGPTSLIEGQLQREENLKSTDTGGQVG